MELQKVYAIYFSPTGTTERAVIAAAKGTGLPGARIDLTPWKSRANYGRVFNTNEVVVVGMPVYGGRLPGKIDNFFSCLKGNNTPAIAMVVYGNRDYEDALIELKIRLEERGFKVIAAAAFIGEHTFSKNIATGRPDAGDIRLAGEFGRRAIAMFAQSATGVLKVKGNYPYLRETFDPANDHRHYTGWAQVGTTADCSFCGLCEETCPWGAITIVDNVITNYSKCMRCFRCIRLCPSKAKRVIDPNFPQFVAQFETRMANRRCQPEMFFIE